MEEEENSLSRRISQFWSQPEEANEVTVDVDEDCDQNFSEDSVSSLSNSITNFLNPILPVQIKLSSNIGDLDKRDSAAGPSIREKFSILSEDNANYIGTFCFHRIPEEFRGMNNDTCNPRLVSIGFIHHGKIQLRGMEEYKFKYLNNFLDTFGVTLDDLTNHVYGQQKVVCDCYEDNPLVNPSKKLNVKPYEVILLDGIFIIELFLKNHFIELRETGDIIFGQTWVSNDIRHDLLLFENQLPLRFLKTLYNTFVSGKEIKLASNVTADPPSFEELVLEYLKDVGFSEYIPETRNMFCDSNCSGHFRHFTGLVAFLCTPPKYYDLEITDKRFQTKVKNMVVRCSTATELKIAGVDFRIAGGSNLLDVHFRKKRGELTLPPLVVNYSTESLLRSLIAFEQSPYHPKFITSYVLLMNKLIATEKDVGILIKHGIIKSELGSSDEVANLFKDDLFRDLLKNPKDFKFYEICDELNDYRRTWRHAVHLKIFRWYGYLRDVYFSTPWSMINFVLGILVVLALTLMQTIFSGIQVKQGQH